MTRYLIGVLAVAALALGGWAWVQSGLISRIRAENASLRASVASYEMERNLAREAQEVAEARARAVEDMAREYDELREGVLRNGEDTVLPYWLRDLIVRLPRE